MLLILYVQDHVNNVNKLKSSPHLVTYSWLEILQQARQESINISGTSTKSLHRSSCWPSWAFTLQEGFAVPWTAKRPHRARSLIGVKSPYLIGSECLTTGADCCRFDRTLNGRKGLAEPVPNQACHNINLNNHYINLNNLTLNWFTLFNCFHCYWNRIGPAPKDVTYIFFSSPKDVTYINFSLP